MNNINLISYGNGWNIGSKTGDPLYSFGKLDPLYKKNLHEHPTNLYNTWVDSIAARLDAKIYFNGRDDITPVIVMDRVISTIKKYKSSADINIHIVNISMPFNGLFLHKPVKINSDTNIKEIFKIRNRDRNIFVDKLKELAKAANKAHKVLLVYPFYNLYENDVIDIPIRNLLKELNNQDFLGLNRELVTFCDDGVLNENSCFLTKEQHNSIGNNIYQYLTTNTNFLTI